jgi:hypothetical protein
MYTAAFRTRLIVGSQPDVNSHEAVDIAASYLFSIIAFKIEELEN